jgi:hypothetical protein
MARREWTARQAAWYGAAQAGYNYRDGLTHEQFGRIIVLLNAFAGAALAFAVWANSTPAREELVGGWSGTWIIAVLFGVGFACMLGMHIDLCTSTSCKGALRVYSERLEAGEGVPDGPWAAIKHRQRLWEERFRPRWRADDGRKPGAPLAKATVFVRVSRFLLAGWLVAAASAVALLWLL